MQTNPCLINTVKFLKQAHPFIGPPGNKLIVLLTILTLLGPGLFRKYQDRGGAHCAPPHEITLII